MKHSTDRILTTHAGSLPRPPDLLALIERDGPKAFDTAAAALTVSGLSGVHALYLARGGLDFLIGDGKLQYGPEYAFESYYSARLFPGFFATFDLQRIANPAFNQDRGPVWVPSLRLHMAFRVDELFRRSRN